MRASTIITIFVAMVVTFFLFGQFIDYDFRSDPCFENPNYKRVDDLGYGFQMHYYCGYGLEGSLWWYWIPHPFVWPLMFGLGAVYWAFKRRDIL